MKFFFKLIPWLFVALFGAEIIAVMLPKKDGEYHVREFGRTARAAQWPYPALRLGRAQHAAPNPQHGGRAARRSSCPGSSGTIRRNSGSTEWLLEVIDAP